MKFFLILLYFPFLISCDNDVSNDWERASYSSVLKPYKSSLIAHRGIWKAKGACENSITAIQNAIDSGVFAAEIDVYSTSDGFLVINHDPMYNNRKITETDYQTLAMKTLSNGEKLPLLSEALKLVKCSPNFNLFIEVKSADLATLLETVNKFKIENQIYYISFSQSVCDQLIQYGHKVLYLGGDIPPKILKKQGYFGLDYKYDVLINNPNWIQEAIENDLVVCTWTLGTSHDIISAFSRNIQFVTADLSLIP